MKDRKIDVLPTRQGYDLWSAIYDAEDNPLVAIEAPIFARLLGDPAGLDVLDLGAGTGRHAIAMSGLGARVTALDGSPGMLDVARAKGGSAIQFVVHDLSTPLPFVVASFDRVVSSLVLEHLPDLPLFFAELARVLRPGGHAVVTAMHPAMMLRGVEAHFTDAATGREVRPQGYAHSISAYVKAVLGARLELVAVEEHAVDEALCARSERAKKHLGWPLLFAMRLAHRPSA